MFLCQILINSCIILMFSPIHYCSSEKTHATGLVPETPFGIKAFLRCKNTMLFLRYCSIVKQDSEGANAYYIQKGLLSKAFGIIRTMRR